MPAVRAGRLAVSSAILAGFPVRSLAGPALPVAILSNAVLPKAALRVAALPVLRRGRLAAVRRHEPGRLKAGRRIGLRLAGFRPLAGLVLGYLCLLGYGAFWLLAIIGLAIASSSSGPTYTF